MHQEHRDLIKKNFKHLVYETDLDLLLPELLRRGVFSSPEEYRGSDKLLCKRKLFLDVQLQGPNAFHDLMRSFLETGQSYVVKDFFPPAQEKRGCKPYKLTSVDELERSLRRQWSNNVHINMNTEGFVIDVVKSDRFLDDVEPTPVYKTRSKFRGLAVIVNNVKFDYEEDDRRGAHVDGRNLRELFKQCGIEVIEHENKKADEIKAIVKEHARNERLCLYDISIFVFMSHGSQNKQKESILKGTDFKDVEVSWIVSQFNNVNCPILKNKPKFFIFQMCRGKLLDSSVERTETDCAPNFLSSFVNDRSFSDILIAHSTLPGFRAHRDVYEGSWYIECLCKMFMREAHRLHIENLLKLVDEKLKTMRSAHLTSQTSMFHNIAFKTCFLHPGIYEENGQLKMF